MSYPQSKPALIRGDCPDLRQMGRLLRGWLDGDGLKAFPLDELRSSWEKHRSQVEGPGGLFEMLEEGAPRLSGEVARLREQHLELEEDIGVLEEFHDPADHRGWISRLADAIDGHCARSAELVYDAFDQDIGGG